MSWPIWLVGTCDHTCWGISSDMPSYPLQECVVPLSWFRWPLSRREPLGLIRPSCLLPWVPPPGHRASPGLPSPQSQGRQTTSLLPLPSPSLTTRQRRLSLAAALGNLLDCGSHWAVPPAVSRSTVSALEDDGQRPGLHTAPGT